MYSPPKNVDFFESRNKGFEIKNPLTGEVKTVQRFRSEDSEEKNLFKFRISIAANPSSGRGVQKQINRMIRDKMTTSKSLESRHFLEQLICQ